MINLDIKRMREKDEAHDYIKRMLGFPEYYGKNLDALYDCLTSLDRADLCFENLGQDNGYFDRMLPVFRDAAEANPGLKLAFADTVFCDADTASCDADTASFDAETTEEEAVPDEEEAFRWE